MNTLLLYLALGGAGAPLELAASPPTEAILAEGLRLYQSERSSWVATDLLLARGLDRNQVGGYFSYLRGDSVCTIFWAEGSAGTPGAPLLGSYVFPRQDVRAETNRYRPGGAFAPAEARLFAIRQTVLATINANPKEFSIPANTSLNIALLEAPAGGTRAYLLMGAEQSGIIPIGNDHLLTFNQANQLTSSERLHNSYLPLGEGAKQVVIQSVMHSHLAAHPYITPTDICTALLYRPPGCRQHLVVGQDYVSIFDLETKQLTIVTRKAYERMNGLKP